MMSNLRSLISTVFLAAAVLLPSAVLALQPSNPTATYTWALEDGEGVVNCSVTAPKGYFAFGFDSDPFEAGTTLTMTVTRSCKALGEGPVEIFTVKGVAPGQTVNRTDKAEPAWQYGFEYTYTAFAQIEKPEGDGEKSVETSSVLKPGYSFSSFFIDSAVASSDLKTVTIKSTVPTEYTDANGNTMPVPENYFTAFKLYCQPASPTPADIPTETFDNPVPGQEYVFKTEKFTLNKENTWYVMAEGSFGNAVSVRRRMYVGYETPGRINITGKQNGRNVDLSWTAPTAGIDGGQMGPYPITYNVYRTWGYGEDNRKLIAEGIEALSYTDTGADMETGKLINYQVVAHTEVGEGNDLCFANGTNYAEKPFGVGPDLPVPFSDKFVGGGYGNDPQQDWALSSTRPEVKFGRPAPTGSGYYDPKIQTLPQFAKECIAYTLFTATSTSKESTMTSWYIDIKSVGKPELSLYYYAIAGNDASLTVEASDGVNDFVTVKTFSISEGLDAGSYNIEDIEANWRHETIDLSPYKEWGGFRLRFKAAYETRPASVMLSHVSIESNESGIGSVTATPAGKTDIYSITGTCVARGVDEKTMPALAPGIYIFRSATAARKVVVK